MKPSANYKMSKQSKIYLGQLWNNPNRGQIRKSIIQSELQASVVVRSKKDR